MWHHEYVNSLNPVAYWRMNEESGTIGYDETGNHNGTYTSSPTLGETGVVVEDDDVVGKSVGFISSQRLENTSLNQSFWNTAASISFWVKIDAWVDAYGRVLSVGVESPHASMQVIRRNTTNILTVEFFSDVFLDIIPDVTLGTWYHCVITKDTQRAKGYVNGQYVTSGIADTTSITTSQILIGDGYRSASLERTDCHLTDVAEFNKVLTESEIQQLYNTGINPFWEISGITKINSVVADANVWLYDSISGELLDSDTSDADFGVYTFKNLAETKKYNLICTPITESVCPQCATLYPRKIQIVYPYGYHGTGTYLDIEANYRLYPDGYDGQFGDMMLGTYAEKLLELSPEKYYALDDLDYPSWTTTALSDTFTGTDGDTPDTDLWNAHGHTILSNTVEMDLLSSYGTGVAYKSGITYQPYLDQNEAFSLEWIFSDITVTTPTSVDNGIYVGLYSSSTNHIAAFIGDFANNSGGGTGIHVGGVINGAAWSTYGTSVALSPLAGNVIKIRISNDGFGLFTIEYSYNGGAYSTLFSQGGFTWDTFVTYGTLHSSQVQSTNVYTNLDTFNFISGSPKNAVKEYFGVIEDTAEVFGDPTLEDTSLLVSDTDGQSIAFDGTGDYIKMPNGTIAGKRTFSFLFQLDNTHDATSTEVQSFISRRLSTSNNRLFTIALVSTAWTGNEGKLMWQMYYGTGETNSVSIYSDANSWTAGQTYHVVCVVDGTTGMRMYIDGVEQADTDAYTSAPEAQTGTYREHIAGWAYISSRELAGSMDEVAMFTTALTDKDVAELYRLASGKGGYISPT